jgi:hypothetical protein
MMFIVAVPATSSAGLAASRDGASTSLHKPLRRNILSSYDMANFRTFSPPMDEQENFRCRVAWRSAERGSTVSLGSGPFNGPYSYKSRFEDGNGTNPDELLAALSHWPRIGDF